ncbi:MAG: ATP-dependent DNA ligase, partial [Terriglobia bacterium]
MIQRFLPMLAVQSQPFDSDNHVFEVKWDGVRALVAIESSGYRVWGRKLTDYSPRYPELETLCSLPSGTVMDGELVALRSGRAKFGELMRRHQLVSCQKVRQAGQVCPVT